MLDVAATLGSGFVSIHALFVPIVDAFGALFRQQRMAGLPYLVEAVRIYGGLVANVLALEWLALFAAGLPLVAALVADVMPGFVQLVGAVTPVLQLVGVLIAALAPIVAVLLGVLVPPSSR